MCGCNVDLMFLKGRRNEAEILNGHLSSALCMRSCVSGPRNARATGAAAMTGTSHTYEYMRMNEPLRLNALPDIFYFWFLFFSSFVFLLYVNGDAIHLG